MAKRGLSNYQKSLLAGGGIASIFSSSALLLTQPSGAPAVMAGVGGYAIGFGAVGLAHEVKKITNKIKKDTRRFIKIK